MELICCKIIEGTIFILRPEYHKPITLLLRTCIRSLVAIVAVSSVSAVHSHCLSLVLRTRVVLCVCFSSSLVLEPGCFYLASRVHRTFRIFQHYIATDRLSVDVVIEITKNTNGLGVKYCRNLSKIYLDMYRSETWE